MANLGVNVGVLVGGVGAPLQYPLINGYRPSWASIEFKFNLTGAGSAPNYAMQSIDYKVTRERKKTRGTSVYPLAKTRGSVDFTCKIKILLAEFNQLIGQLGQLDPTGNNAYGDVAFELDVSYTEPAFTIVTDQILGCTIDSVEQSSSEGVEDIVIECELAPLQILRNGQPISSVPLAAPQF